MLRKTALLCSRCVTYPPMVGSKACARCTQYMREYRVRNLDKIKATARRFSARNREALRDRQRMMRYGLSASALRELKEKPRCDACNHPFDSVCGSQHSRHIDHDHATGAVRGVLCQQCNLALGYLEDSPQRAEALAAYVRRHVRLLTSVA